MLASKIQLKEAHETYLKDIFTSETHRLTKKAWSYIKSQRRDNIGIPPLLNEKGELCEDAEDKAEILSRQYTSVFTQDNPLEPVPDVPYSLPSMPDINIEENGILKLLKDVNVYKVIGPDLIPNRILKDSCVELAPLLTEEISLYLCTYVYIKQMIKPKYLCKFVRLQSNRHYQARVNDK